MDVFICYSITTLTLFEGKKCLRKRQMKMLKTSQIVTSLTFICHVSLGQEENCYTLKHLTLYHTISTFNDPEKKKSFENIVGKGENAGNQL